jgi:hypothetical protein
VNKQRWAVGKLNFANRTSANLRTYNNLLDLRTFRKHDTLRMLDLWAQSFLRFADLKRPQVRKYIQFLLTIIANIVML